MDNFPEDLSDWGISEQYGFVMEDPLDELPEYFRDWNQTAKSLPSLVKSGLFREAVDKMQLLDHTRLTSYKELRLAHLQLSFFAAGYVWQDGDNGVVESIPKQVAVPLYGVSRKLDTVPGINHACFSLANWRKIDNDGPMEAENLQSLYTLPGGKHAEYFVTISVEMEASMAPVYQVIPDIFEAVNSKDDSAICEHLNVITDCLNRCEKAMGKIHEYVSPKILFEEVRPFLYGWGQEGTALPNGLIYEGVSDIPIKIPVGGTSAMLMPIDGLLGLKCDKNKTYKEQEKEHLPVGHRKFVRTIEKHSRLRDYVTTTANSAVKSAYNDVTAALCAFRLGHAGVSTRYIYQVFEDESTSKKYNKYGTRGTSGQEAHPTLENVIEATNNCFV